MGRRLAADARLRGLHAALRNIKRNLCEGNATKEANSSGFTRLTMRWARVSSASVYIWRQFFRDAAAENRSFPGLQQSAGAAGALQQKQKGAGGGGEETDIEQERHAHQIETQFMSRQQRAQSLEDIGRRQQRRDELQRPRQDRQRIEDAGERLHQEHEGPDERFRRETVAQNEARTQKPDRPARQDQIREKQTERQSQPPEIE